MRLFQDLIIMVSVWFIGLCMLLTRNSWQGQIYAKQQPKESECSVPSCRGSSALKTPRVVLMLSELFSAARGEQTLLRKAVWQRPEDRRGA